MTKEWVDFFLKHEHAGGSDDITFGFGPENATWLPIRDNWDCNGVDTIGLYDPQEGGLTTQGPCRLAQSSCLAKNSMSYLF